MKVYEIFMGGEMRSRIQGPSYDLTRFKELNIEKRVYKTSNLDSIHPAESQR